MRPELTGPFPAKKRVSTLSLRYFSYISPFADPSFISAFTKSSISSLLLHLLCSCLENVILSYKKLSRFSSASLSFLSWYVVSVNYHLIHHRKRFLISNFSKLIKLVWMSIRIKSKCNSADAVKSEPSPAFSS